MKKLIIINGTMGVGKSTVSKILNLQLENSVWLDGDWCWMMNPWNFSDENKDMVLENICFLLSNYLKNSSFEYVIFSWVLHLETIIESILERLKNFEFQKHVITLTCSRAKLIERMLKRGDRLSATSGSLERLSLYEAMITDKIDTSNLSVENIVCRIVEIVQSSK